MSAAKVKLPDGSWVYIAQGQPGPPGPSGDVALEEHLSDTTNVHGIPDTSLLETKAGAQAKVDVHAVQTVNVHGIMDFDDLVDNDAPNFTLIYENGLV
jgi:hypothetical protein